MESIPKISPEAIEEGEKILEELLTLEKG